MTYDYKRHKFNLRQAKAKFIQNAIKGLTYEQIEELKKYNYDTDAWMEAIQRRWSKEGISEEWIKFENNLVWGVENQAKVIENKEKELDYSITPEQQIELDRMMKEWEQKRANGEYDVLDVELEQMKKDGKL